MRKTYASRNGEYNLDPAKVFNVVAEISFYLNLATREAKRENREWLKPVSKLLGKGRALVANTDVTPIPNTLGGFDLAELVLSAENDSLTLRINEHPMVLIRSEGLHTIGKKYSLE